MHISMTLERDASARMGEDRRRLLAAIREHGSISAAARAVGLSYKAAWDAVRAMNNVFGRPLVQANTGGRRGGGAVLTPAGESVLAALAVVEADLGRWLGRLQRHLGDPASPPDTAVLWSLLMKTSARNLFRCTVREVVDGAVHAEVALHMSGGQQLVAVVTRRSVAELGLAPGREAFALVKSSFVILVPEQEAGRTSARNRLCGTVIARDDGAVNSEFVLDIGGGMAIVAIVTLESARTLGLEVGDRACALVKASHVILAV
jgi:molybdate transport system regulatory protein